MALFGQSFGAFGDRLKGLLGDPEQQTALLSNPMFRMGTGILANPGEGVAGAVKGLAAAKAQGQSDEDRERMEKLREQLSQLIQKQLGGGGDPTTPTEEALQMSLLPGMAGSGVAGAAAGAAGMPQDIMSLIGGAAGAGAMGGGGAAAGMATNPQISALAQGAQQGAPQAEMALQNQAREMLAMQGVTQPTQQEMEMMLNALRAQAGQ